MYYKAHAKGYINDSIVVPGEVFHSEKPVEGSWFNEVDEDGDVIKEVKNKKQTAAEKKKQTDADFSTIQATHQGHQVETRN